MSFSFLDVIMFLGISQGLFLIFSLLKIRDNNTLANKLLALILLLCSLILVARLVYTQHFSNWMIRWITLPDTIILAIGPLTYFYVHSILFKKKLPRIFYISGVPFLIYLTLGLLLAFASSDWLLSIKVNSWLSWAYFLVEGFAISFNAFFLIKSGIMLYEFKKLEEHNLSFRQKAVTYLQFFLFSLLSVLIVWGIVFITGNVFGMTSKLINYNTVWILIPMLFYIVSYFMLGEPKLFRFSDEKKVRNNKRLNDEKIVSLSRRLDEVMDDEKVYLNNDLTLKNLADLVDSSSNDVSWLLNESYKKNFYDYINSFRIKAFLEEIRANRHANRTLLSIAMDVGFNSKSAFNNSFKKEMGVSPREYLQGVKK